MRVSFLSTLLLALALAAPAGAQERDEVGENALLERLNALRTEAGLSPLARDAHLDAAARTHSVDMAWHQLLDHVSPRTGTPADRVAATGLEVGSLAENVAFDANSAEAQASLEASEAHAQNMLAPTMTHVGISAVYADGGVYVTEVFAAIAGPAESTSPAVAPPVIAPVPAPAPVMVRTVASTPVRPPAATAPAPAPATTTAATTVAVTGPGQERVVGYWVSHEGRWYYYPMPADAQPGQRLVPDLSVTGGPPGYAHPQAPRAPILPVGQPVSDVTYIYQAPPAAGAVVRRSARSTIRIIAPGTTTARRAPRVYRYRF